MKVVIYSVPTVNGFIARHDEKDYTFISDVAWNGYLKALRTAGVFVMGRRTFEVSRRTGAFPYPCLNIVMTKRAIKNRWGDTVIFTAAKPKDVLRMLKRKGFRTILVTGGHLSASFLRDTLADELWIDLMPHVFAKGVPLFDGADFDARLKLIGIKRIAGSGVQLRYKIITYR